MKLCSRSVFAMCLVLALAGCGRSVLGPEPGAEPRLKQHVDNPGQTPM